ncbi:MAG TPA: hypothetical protein ENI85_04645 [Deltaproteobacteria bacterium]|nr:hypothetical protein [Deltaproteobacteria bacterium]
MKHKRFVRTLTTVGILLVPAFHSFAEEEDIPAPMTWQQLMTREEREQYRAAMQALETREERAALRARHQAEMRERAKARGIELPARPRPSEPQEGAMPATKDGRLRGHELMTAEEREAHREEMRSKATAEEREETREKHHETMTERAREWGVALPDRPMPRGRGGSGRGARR